MSIRKKIVLFFTISSLIPFSIVALVVFIDVRAALEASAIRHLDTIATYQKERTEAIASEYETIVKAFASRRYVQENLQAYVYGRSDWTHTQMLDAAQDFSRTFPAIRNLSVVTARGTVIASTRSDWMYTNVSALPAFEAGLKGADASQFVKEGGVVYLYASAPIIVSGRTLGVVIAEFSTEKLFSMYRDFSHLGETGSWGLAVANEKGDAIFVVPGRFDTDPDSPLQATLLNIPENSERPIMQALAGVERAFPDLTDYLGHEVIVATRYLKERGWAIGVMQRQSEVFAPVRELLEQFIFFALLLALSSGFIGFVLTSTIVNPIRELSDASRRVLSGDFSVRLFERSGDEIGVATKVFNSMVSQIQNMKNNLEEDVRSKTRELEQAQARDAAVLASIVDGVIVLNMHGDAVYLNGSARQILGIDTATGIDESKVFVNFEFYQEDTHTPLADHDMPLQKALRGEDILNKTYFVRWPQKKEGRFLTISLRLVSVSGAHGAFGALLVIRDVTEEKEIDKAKSDFVSIASHQLRTPLSTIRWYVEMLRSGRAGPLVPVHDRYAAEIQKANTRLIELVNALLSATRLDFGNTVFRSVETDVGELLRDVLASYAERVSEGNLTFTTDIPESPIILRTDIQNLTILFQNIIGNAVKYSRSGGKILVRLTMNESPRGITFSVKDTGIGIPEHEQGRIFEKMFRASNVATLDTDGTGLGLYIVKSIVSRFGGTISFQSDEGKGTTFVVYIPEQAS